MIRRCLTPILFTLLLISWPRFGVGEGQEKVRAWTDEVVIPTYPLSADDVNPRFFELDGSIIYPYTMQDNLTTTKGDRTYKAAYLENEYLRVMCLPEIGGRIQSVYDKRRDEEMFYRNHVIKPGLIALRGAWISGGVEWNRGPTGHTVTSFSPVDVVTVENPDGSASLIIGNTEMNFRTGWSVRLTLHPGRAYLDEEISIFNPTDGFHSYYFWNNTAFPNRAGTRYIYPMTLGTDHDGINWFSWPIHEGRDMTWLKNYPDPSSIFAHDCAFDFFGAYDVDRDYGLIQVANHYVTPGKKAWTWGNADSGLASQAVLTDEDGPYIEVQSGPLPTQADFGMLVPGQKVAWREWWYPVFGLGQGFEYANEDVVVERIENEEGIELRVMPTGQFLDASLVVSRQDETLVSDRVDLTPSKIHSVRFESGRDESVEIALTSRDGKILLSYISPLDVPKATPPVGGVERPSTVEEFYLEGQRFDRQTNRVAARTWYEKALEQDPGHAPSLTALAVLDLESGLFDSAADRLGKAVRRDPRAGMAWYLRGVAELRRGYNDQALRFGYQAAQLPGTTALGYGLVGRALMRQGDRPGALEAFRLGIDIGGSDGERLREQMLVAAYASGEMEKAQSIANRIVEKGSTRLVPHAVLALSNERPLEEFASNTRCFVGEDEFAFLELAVFFAELGLHEETIRLLTATLVEGVPESDRRPLPLYYVAYYSSLLGRTEEARRYLDEAGKIAVDYVFPSRTETIAVLLFGIEEFPEDARAHLYLGNLYAGLGRLEEAVPRWEKATALDSNLSVAHRNLGLFHWKKHEDLARAAERYEKAIAARPSDQVLYRDLAQIRVAQNRPADAIDLLENVPTKTRRRADLTVLLARTYIETERYSDAIDLLVTATFSNWEGDRDVWALFSRAHIERGIQKLDGGRAEPALEDFSRALTYPENLNVGRSSKPQEARALYWKGKALATLGRSAEATAAWQEGSEGAPGDEEQNEHITKCREELAKK
jgi:tetratricopeptide (TPR) repeat protein